jgi:hypothetical protein
MTVTAWSAKLRIMNLTTSFQSACRQKGVPRSYVCSVQFMMPRYIYCAIAICSSVRGGTRCMIVQGGIPTMLARRAQLNILAMDIYRES